MLHMLYDIILPEPSTSFYMTCDLWLSSDVTDMWQLDPITLTLIISSKNWKYENKLERK